ncbi:MAG: GDP-mannose 4,6-dehydratase [Candidatus Cloacimonetes bacterium]|nr:GDP-mannose 4,6-dehydratase [Candidatus Cloacimonadota bacterium]
MKILVTGGAGFIGSHLCDKLLKEHHQIICIDNFCDFYDPMIKQQNIKEASFYPNFKVFKVDITDYKSLENIFMKNNFDLVIHLAAMAGVRSSIENPLIYAKVNITGTLNILEMCRIFFVKKIIFASSSSVYGNNEKTPFSETDNVDNPISPYAASKRAGELLCYTYHSLYDMSIVCLRFFTVYGPRQRPDLAIYKFTKLIYENKEIPVYGKGDTQRDYTYIDDIIDGVIKSIDYIFLGNKYQIFNLGESETISLNEMISILESSLMKKVKRKYLNLQAGDVIKTYADINKSKKLLKYDPKISFDDGIKKFVAWYNLSKH